MKNKKGVNLIVLTVTIIVMIIIAGAVIYSTRKSDQVNKAKKSVFKTDYETFKETLEDNLTEKVLEDENFDKTSVNLQGDEVKEYIPEFKSNYYEKFAIENGVLIYIGTNSKEKEWLKEIEEESDALPAGWSSANVVGVVTEKITNNEYTDKEFKAPIPRGFEVSTITGENKISDGLVIIDKKNGNEFVWTPIVNTSEMFDISYSSKYSKLYDFSNTGVITLRNSPETDSSNTNREPYAVVTDGDINNIQKMGISASNLAGVLSVFQNEYSTMIASVKKYGGFYIGRYESTVEKSTDVLRIRKGEKVDISGLCWYDMYRISKNAYATSSSVRSMMIYGIQWDETLKWINTFGDIGEKDNRNLQDKPKLTGVRKVKNVYDLGGNLTEYTQESFAGDSRVHRGMSFTDRNTYNGYASSKRCNAHCRPFEIEVEPEYSNEAFRVAIILE